MTQEEAIEMYKGVVKAEATLALLKAEMDAKLIAKAIELGILPGEQWDYLGDGKVKPADQCAKVLKR